jgi:hypothetical protein
MIRDESRMKRVFNGSSIGVVIILVMLRASAHAVAPPCTAKYVPISRLELVEILQRDGFSLPLYPQTEFERLGEISVGKSCFVVFLFTVAYRSAPGTNPHFAARLLVLRDYKYLGMYLLDNENLPTRVEGNRVEFPGMTKDRNVVIFAENGPPREVWLHGAMREFTK